MAQQVIVLLANSGDGQNLERSAGGPGILGQGSRQGVGSGGQVSGGCWLEQGRDHAKWSMAAGPVIRPEPQLMSHQEAFYTQRREQTSSKW